MEKKSKIPLLLLLMAGLALGVGGAVPLYYFSQSSRTDEEISLYKKQVQDYKKIAEEYHQNLLFFQRELKRGEVYREMARKHKKQALKFEEMAHKALYKAEILRLENSQIPREHRKKIRLILQKVRELLESLEKLKGLPRTPKKDLLSLEEGLKALQKDLSPPPKAKGPPAKKKN